MTGAGFVDVVAMGLLVAGSLLSLTAAIGLLRFPDVLSRLHAATKPQVLGTILILVALALRVDLRLDLGLLVLAGIAQMLTIPVAANMVGRAAYRSGQARTAQLVIDDLRGAEPVRTSRAGPSRPPRPPGSRRAPRRR